MPVRRQTRSGRSRPASSSPSRTPPPANRHASRYRTPSPRHRRSVRERGSPKGSLSRSRSPRRRIRFEDEIGDRAEHERALAAARRQKRPDTSNRIPSRGSNRAISRPPQTPDRRGPPADRRRHQSPIRRTWGPDLTRQRAGINEALRRNERMLPGQAAPDGLDEDIDDAIQKEIEEDRARQRAIDRGFLFSANVTVRVKRGSIQTVELKKDICPGGDQSWCGAASFDMDMLNETVSEVVVSKHLSPQFERIFVSIKSPKSNVSNEGATMNGLTREDFSKDIEPVLERLWRSSPGYELMIYINIDASSEASRSAPPVASRSEPSPSTPPQRRTRTLRLEEQATARRDANEAAGDFIEKLIDKWRCHKDTCRNHGQHCYVPSNGPERGQHFVLTQTMFDLWANHLRDIGENDLKPPKALEDIITAQGSVETALKHPSAAQRRETEQERRDRAYQERENRRQDAQDRLMDAYMKQQTMQMDMANMRMMQQQQSQMAAMQMPLDPSPFVRPEPQNPPQYAQNAPVGPSFAQPAAQAAPARAPNSSSTNTTQICMDELGRSSPIAERIEAETAWEAFWQWKASITAKPARRQTYQEVHRICDANFWGLRELKAMSDRQSEIYRLGLQANIPDGLMLGFREDLKDFKPLWRSVLRPQMQQRASRYRGEDRSEDEEEEDAF